MELITPKHPRWEEFCRCLEGPEGCNFQLRDPGDPDSVFWFCLGGNDQSKARAILARMGLKSVEIEASLQYFRNHGGYCDCEILMNVDRPREAATKEDV
jgi:hypothetical protein